jgi:hypothetical protein
MVSMTKVISLTHRRDPDGIVSAAILKRYADEMGLGFEVLFADYHTMASDLKKLEGRVDEFIIVSDMRLDAKYLKDAVPILGKLRKNYNIIEWYDHHNWDEKSKEIVDSLVHKLVINPSLDPETRQCGAQLVQAAFMPDDKTSRKLAEIASDNDFPPQKDERGLFLGRLIQYYVYQDREDKLENLVQKLAKGRLKTPRMLWDDRKYRKKKNEAIKTLHKNAEIHEIAGIPFYISHADPIISSSEACYGLIDKAKAEDNGLVVALVVFHSDEMQKMNGKVSIRRPVAEDYKIYGVPEEEWVSCVTIANIFDGGGRVDTAGGSIEIDEPERMKQYIIKRLKEEFE